MEIDLEGRPDDRAVEGDAAGLPLVDRHGVQPEDIRIVGVGQIPRSSANKIARRVAAKAYTDGKF